jgi:glycosyltransferase involved in cell wall biosynthesis
MKDKKLKLSIVIPVFNEQDYLENCLNSIAAQSDTPDEVIVVDNNSTDMSVRIAERYSFVTLISEKQQSQVFAQKTGFDHASGDIIGRIDADAILPEHWVSNVKAAFKKNPRAVAITGYGEPYDVPLRTVGVAAMRTYLYVASKIAGHRMIWGSNCAIMARDWAQISRSVLQRADVWEDYDLAFKISARGSIVPADRITVKFSGRSAHKPLLQQYSYQFRSLRTFFLNASLARTMVFAVVAHTMLILFPIVALDTFISKRSQSQHLASVKLKLGWLTGRGD